MPKYIDAEKLRNELYDADAFTFKGLAILDNQKTIDVVRCQDCMWAIPLPDTMAYKRYTCSIIRSDSVVTGMDYCSIGEMKTE